MNLRLVLVIVTALGMLLSSVILPLQLNDIYAEESQTNTEQGLSQENVGSSESININCGENSIDSTASIICPTETGEQPVGGGPPITLTLRNCTGNLSPRTEIFCEVVAPFEFVGRLSCFQSVLAIQCFLDRLGGRINLSCLSIPSPFIPRSELQITICQRLD